MRKHLWILPMPVILAVAVLAAACGGGGGTTATRTPTASPSKTATAAATKTATVSPTKTATTTPAVTKTPAVTPTPAVTLTPAVTPTPAPSAQQIDVTAQNFAFDKTSIQVTAGQPFTIVFHNNDTAAHNLDIYDRQGGTSIAVTVPQSVPPGGTGTLTATITQPGTYFFQCDFHASIMTGTLTVQ